MNNIQETFEQFRNEVFCRRESNQHKAKKLWPHIKAAVPEKVWKNFEIEWNHYKMGEFEPRFFSEDVKKLKEHLPL